MPASWLPHAKEAGRASLPWRHSLHAAQPLSRHASTLERHCAHDSRKPLRESRTRQQWDQVMCDMRACSTPRVSRSSSTFTPPQVSPIAKNSMSVGPLMLHSASAVRFGCPPVSRPRRRIIQQSLFMGSLPLGASSEQTPMRQTCTCTTKHVCISTLANLWKLCAKGPAQWQLHARCGRLEWCHVF